MRPAGMELWQARRRRVRALHGSGGVRDATLRGAALMAWRAQAVPALAQDNLVATATLPRDLSPWGMYLNADPVVKAVLIGLALASVVTWTVWLAKSIEIFFAKRRVRTALSKLAGVRSTLEDVPQLAEIQDEVAQILHPAPTQPKLSPPATHNQGIQEPNPP